MTKTLILIRHGDRDVNGLGDDSLNSNGRKRAEELARKFNGLFDTAHENHLFLTSAKMRCMQTLEPTAHVFGASVQADPLLMEQMRNESFSEFIDRVKIFTDQWKRSSEQRITFACSHGDWLPIAVDQLLHLQVDFKKGGYLIIEDRAGKLIQV
jgi:broad specificity phosphatase PhoE